jgi:hypothetical protein
VQANEAVSGAAGHMAGVAGRRGRERREAGGNGGAQPHEPSFFFFLKILFVSSTFHSSHFLSTVLETSTWYGANTRIYHDE